VYTFQRGKRRRRLLYSTVTLVILALAALVLARSAWLAHGKYALARRNLADAKRQINELRARQTYLEQEVGRLSSPRGVEEEIRSRFQVTKDDEEVLVVVDQPTVPATSPSGAKRLWEWFKRIWR